MSRLGLHSFVPDSFETRSVTSVGAGLATSTLLGRSNPAYTAVADAVGERVSRLAERDSAKRRGAKSVLMTVSLSIAEFDSLRKQYPEFNLHNYASRNPGHAYYVASRVLANEYLTYQASRYTDSIMHVGGSVLSYIVGSQTNVHVEMDTTNAIAVHERHEESIQIARIMGDYVALAEDIGVSSARPNYEKYLTRQAFNTCTKGSVCTHQSEAMCVDLSLYPVSPQQFCCGMRQAGATVGFGFFPYDPAMLLTDKGAYGDTGVRFEKTSKALLLKFPEGEQSASVIPLTVWSAWLSEHEVVIGVGKGRRVYHCQLSKARGPFMFFQMTLVDTEPGQVTLRHVLDLPVAQESYVVTAYVLRDLALDPSLERSWDRLVFTFDKRVFDKLFEFAMQLSQDAFGRYAIRKQLKVMDRVTLEGTVVTHGNVPEQDSAIVGIVHAEAFVARYESGQLSKELMAALKSVAEFGSASRLARVKAVASWSMSYMWDCSFGLVGEMVSSLCGWLRRIFVSVDRQPQFALAPTYTVYQSLVSSWRVKNSLVHGDAVRVLASMSQGVVRRVRGGALVEAVAGASRVVEDRVTGTAAAASVSQVVTETVYVELDDTSTSLTGAVSLGPAAMDALQDALVSDLKALNEFDEPSVGRHHMPTTRVVREFDQTTDMRPDFEFDPDYIQTLNDVYREFNPEVVGKPIARDIASLSQDDQDRHLVAEFLRIPRHLDSAPVDREYWFSKLNAINAPKRQETQHELLSAAAARTLAAPKISLPQDTDTLVVEIWENFVARACVENAKGKIAEFCSDPVALEEVAYRDWMAKATPDSVKAVKRELENESQALGEMPVGEYLMMLKADVKPPLGDKPARARIEPQVIVYHRKALSSMYSAMFRVLVRRFLSLLLPNVHVNLLKDSRDIAGFIRACHPYGQSMTYAENDFGKYDKSQDEFVFALEAHVFRQLGLNEDMLARWVEGHVDCSLRSVTTGISLTVRYQRKSGDATTSFGNVLLNILSVYYAYSPSNVAWAVFMGDDSIMALRTPSYDDRATAILAEVFNLTAKMFVTKSPYFASNFIVVDDENRHVALVPDPIKWIEKRSQPIPVEDVQWAERYTSASDACLPYRYRLNTSSLGRMVAERHSITRTSAERVVSAVATATSSAERFRACYDEFGTFVRY